MSGPISTADAAAHTALDGPVQCDLEVLEARQAHVGAFAVRRLLPRRQRRTVGAWCFVDHMGPADLTGGNGLDIGPHPHIGLQTVTWLFDGEVLHRDSLGSEQLIRPGQLNLMTAGHGVAHAEESPATTGLTHGVQLWVAQPRETRDGAAAFATTTCRRRASVPCGRPCSWAPSLGSPRVPGWTRRSSVRSCPLTVPATSSCQSTRPTSTPCW